jgi:murein DD-endopeptidase MepM/ murein hydrolase activator NlpD
VNNSRRKPLRSFYFSQRDVFRDPVNGGDGNLRRTRHEGIDFAEGRQPGGEMGRIPEGTPVRAMVEGKVVAVLDDFLGKTVVVRHPAIVRPDGTVLCTLYSHIQPDSGLSGPVAKRQLLGRVAKQKAAGAPAHLHLTGAWIRRTMGPGEITMDRISPGYAPVVLSDFNGLLAGMVRDPKFGIRD